MSYAGGMDAALVKEEARIRLKREQNAVRRDRFLDARKRVFGLDVEALDAQVAEKAMNDQNAADAESTCLIQYAGVIH